MEGRRSLRARRFEGLMPFRVREVLLVSSPFDAFVLEEDGLLTERVFLEFMDIGLPSSPRFTHAASGKEALDALAAHRFDLVLSMTSVSDMDLNTFARRAKRVRDGVPVVLLSLDAKELLDLFGVLDPKMFDGAFLWSGDAKILLTIVKYVEDSRNVDHDIEQGNVRVIVMIEDSPRYYSSFLGLFYRELMAQSRALYAEGVDEIHRQAYMKSRPKILHARTYERGMDLYERYRLNIMAVICDLRFPKGGQLEDRAGIAFLTEVRRADPSLPLLLQSAGGEGQRAAEDLGAVFVDKNSPSLLADLRRFLRRNLGFGDLVFRLPDGEEVARARDLRQLAETLEQVPAASIRHHATRNDFSLWLQARSEFELAEKLRPQRVSDFASIEATREHLISELHAVQESTYRGVVSDFDRHHFDVSPFSRLGPGALGGKARGLAFLDRLLTGCSAREFGGLRVSIPRSVVVTTEFFDRFLDENDLREMAAGPERDAVVVDRFLAAPLADELNTELEFLVSHLDGPLAVRSSSLLEDSLHQAVAGIYLTLMIPNNGPDTAERLRQLSAAIKLVYASVFFKGARSYLESTGHLLEEEKMAVIIQPVVGRLRNERFYPSFSGVAESYNFYPIGPQRPEDGVALLALGLGRQIVEGGQSLRASPRHPGVVPQLATREGILHGTQRRFWAVDLTQNRSDTARDLLATMRRFDLATAEGDGALLPVASVYSRDEDRLIDDLSHAGPRILTFNNILKHGAIALPEALERLLEIAQDGLGSAVELEFACEMGDWGEPSVCTRERIEPELFVLQVRPFSAELPTKEDAQVTFKREALLCRSRRSLGHGVFREIRDLVYVDRGRWEAAANRAIAGEVGRLNHRLGGEGRPFVLIGPGRWGSADDWLGIPVDWSQISNVKVLIEASPAGYEVEPSQGTHFFHNLTSLGLGYLTLPPGAEKVDSAREFIDWGWLDAQEPRSTTRHLRHLRFEDPLTVVLDGRRRRGVVARPGSQPEAG